MSQISIESKENTARIYYTKLDLKTSKLIRKKPFVMIHRNFSEKLIQNSVKCFCYNDLFSKIGGIKNANITEPQEGFQSFEVIFSRDWMAFYDKLLKFCMDLKESSIDLTEEELLVIPKNGTQVPGFFR